MQDLDLESHGLKVLSVDPERIHPFPDGRAVRVWNDDAQVAEEIARISPPDADAYFKWVDFWVRAARIIHPYMLTAPPTLAEVMASVQGTDDEAVLERILFGSAYDMLDQFFESEQVKALFAWSFNDASSLLRSPGDLPLRRPPIPGHPPGWHGQPSPFHRRSRPLLRRSVRDQRRGPTCPH